MTAATKRKHVVKEMLEDFSIPDEGQFIVKVLGTPGSNLHETITPEGKKFLCSLPTKFRKNIWIKRGDYVVVESITEGDKVKAEIVRILYPQHVKCIQKQGCWPKQFEADKHKGKYPEGKVVDKVAAKVEALKLNPESASYKEDFIMNIKNAAGDSPDEDEFYSSEDDLSDIPANTNRPAVVYEEDSTSDSDEDFSSGE